MHVVQRCRVFKSARSPVRFVFSTAAAPRPSSSREAADAGRAAEAEEALLTSPGEPIQMIFKSGDDLRQDQFVCQVGISEFLVPLAHCHIAGPLRCVQALKHRSGRRAAWSHVCWMRRSC